MLDLYTPMGLMADLLTATAIFAVAGLVGRACGKALLPLAALDRWERRWLEMTLGLGALSLLTLGLGLAGLLFRPAVLAAGAVLAVTAMIGLRRFPAAPPRTGAAGVTRAEAADGAAGARLPRIPLILAAPLLLHLFFAALTPEVRSDPVSYHLSLPMLYAAHGRVLPLPWHAFDHFPANTEMLYTLAVLFARDTAAKLVIFGHGLLMTAGTFLFARRFLGAHAAPWAVLILLLQPWTAYLTTACYVDAALANHALAALFCAIAALRRGTPRAWIAAGVFTGLALGCKYTALPFFLVPLGAALLLAPRPDPLRMRLRQVLLLGLAALIVFAPWPARNLHDTGNPVFPLLTGVFGPQFDRVGEAADWMYANHTPPPETWRSPGALLRWSAGRIAMLARFGEVLPFLFGIAAAFHALRRFGGRPEPLPDDAPPGMRGFLYLWLGFVFAAYLAVSNNPDGRFIYFAYPIMAAMTARILVDGKAFLSRRTPRLGTLALAVIIAALALSYVNKRMLSLGYLHESAWPVVTDAGRDRVFRTAFSWHPGDVPVREALSPGGAVLGNVYPLRVRWIGWHHGWRDAIGERMADATPEELLQAFRDLRIEVVVVPNNYPLDPGLLETTLDRHGRLIGEAGGRRYFAIVPPDETLP